MARQKAFLKTSIILNNELFYWNTVSDTAFKKYNVFTFILNF